MSGRGLLARTWRLTTWGGWFFFLYLPHIWLNNPSANVWTRNVQILTCVVNLIYYKTCLTEWIFNTTQSQTLKTALSGHTHRWRSIYSFTQLHCANLWRIASHTWHVPYFWERKKIPLLDINRNKNMGHQCLDFESYL